MKIHLTSKVWLVTFLYVVVAGLIVYFGDFFFKTDLAFLPNVLVGAITIIAGFNLAYWLIESNKVAKDLERKNRVLSTLKVLKNFLLPWIYDYATALSGKIELDESYPEQTPYSKRYKEEISILEYIFGIGEYKNGEKIRGNYSDSDKEIENYAFVVDAIDRSVDWGLRALTEVEKRIQVFPSFLDEINPEIAKIIHLSNFVRERKEELREWERKCGEQEEGEITFSSKNTAIRSNLKTIGRTALDVFIEIDANIDKITQEMPKVK